MNHFGFIDYKKPGPAQNDYRTSTYRGHVKLEQDALTTSRPQIASAKSVQPQAEPIRVKSEHQEQYCWKPPDPYVVRNPTVNNVKLMKRFEDAYLRNPPKQLKTMSSTFQRDFPLQAKDNSEKHPCLPMRNAVETTRNLTVNPAKPGYVKLLDPAATTSNLTYTPYTIQELGISTKDNITFWNWNQQKNNVFKIKQTMCDKFKSSQCPKRRREFPSTKKAVPHSGLTTESRSHYVRPVGLIFDISEINTKLVSCPQALAESRTQNMLYGSGERIQSFLS